LPSMFGIYISQKGLKTRMALEERSTPLLLYFGFGDKIPIRRLREKGGGE